MTNLYLVHSSDAYIVAADSPEEALNVPRTHWHLQEVDSTVVEKVS